MDKRVPFPRRLLPGALARWSWQSLCPCQASGCGCDSPPWSARGAVRCGQRGGSRSAGGLRPPLLGEALSAGLRCLPYRFRVSPSPGISASLVLRDYLEKCVCSPSSHLPSFPAPIFSLQKQLVLPAELQVSAKKRLRRGSGPPRAAQGERSHFQINIREVTTNAVWQIQSHTWIQHNEDKSGAGTALRNASSSRLAFCTRHRAFCSVRLRTGRAAAEAAAGAPGSGGSVPEAGGWPVPLSPALTAWPCLRVQVSWSSRRFEVAQPRWLQDLRAASHPCARSWHEGSRKIKDFAVSLLRGWEDEAGRVTSPAGPPLG